MVSSQGESQSFRYFDSRVDSTLLRHEWPRSEIYDNPL